MAEINTGPTEEKFVFGQNMEDRAIKPPSEGKEELPKSENGADVEKPATVNSPVRQSAFRPGGGGILAPSRLGSNPFVSRPSASNHSVVQDVSLNANPFAAKSNPSTAHISSEHDGPTRMILKPSALDRQTANLGKNTTSVISSSPSYKSSFKLEPAKLKNPFSQPKSDHKENMTESENAAPETEKSEIPLPKDDDPSDPLPTPTNVHNETKPVETTPAKEETVEKAPKKAAEPKSFVFGQNMGIRVKDPASGQAEAGPSAASDFLFGENTSVRVTGVEADKAESAASSENDQEKSSSAAGEASGQTLVESAAAYQAKQTRPELQEVEVTTGEENESNVFQVNAKLFSFDSDTQSWLERGRGLLRLNDMTDSNESAFQSRLVMRTTGCLRVILNTKIWAGMSVERASPRSVRVTAAETDGDIKIFLIMTNPKDADQIISALDWRVQELKKTDTSEISSTPSSDTQDTKVAQECSVSPVTTEKRQSDTSDTSVAPAKKARLDTDQRRELPPDESSESSTLDPETEGKTKTSNESFTSTNKSSSSE